MALRSKNLPHTQWEYVLPDTLHSIRSLLCTATNCTPHERMFLHTRKTFNGVSLPSWVKPGPVYIKRHNRNKNDLLVEEAELIEANPHYAHVRLENGREISVSLRDLAPNPRSLNDQNSVNETFTNNNSSDVVPKSPDHYNTPASHDNIIENNVEFSNSSNHDKSVVDEQEAASHDTPAPRRSTRVRRPVDRYGNNIYS